MTETAPNAPLILVVDDEPSHLDSVATILRREGWRTAEATSGPAALELVRREQPAVLLTDLAMPGMDGTELMRAARTITPELEVVLMTAHGTVETAVAAMKDGAYDFLVKPLKRAQVVKAISRAIEKRQLLEENLQLRAKVAQLAPGGGVVGQSPAFRAMMDIVRQAAPSTATVLVIGESGTGKELVARALHDLSPRASSPFVPVNMAALPESIVESELFGHERGAFTGAIGQKKGRFERADRGTLFLDEVGEMSASVQVKLLRVIQEGEFERVGGTQPVKVDVRIVAATNKNLALEVKEGRFREDLFYRLNVVRIGPAPLRERDGDVALLAQHFLRHFAAKNGKAVFGFTEDALAALERHAWPGNVRELENAIERAVVLGRGAQVEVGDLPEDLRGTTTAPPAARAIIIPIGTPMDEIELRVIHETLRHTGGDKTLAAQLLGIATRTIYRKLGRERDGQARGAEAGVGAIELDDAT